MTRVDLTQPSTQNDMERVNAPTTREEWLERLVEALRPCFDQLQAPLPERLRISCGWPKSPGALRHPRALGTIWPGARDGVLQIFVSPVLVDLEGPESVGAIVTHECVHAAAGLECHHRGPFKTMGDAIGLEPPMPSSTASPRLQALLSELCAPLGPYPHSPLSEPGRKDTTRMLKLACPVCGYAVRTTQMWIERGLPSCPDGDVMERVP